MKIIIRIVWLAALAALGLWLWLALFPGPQKVVRNRLAELARAVSSSPNESDLTRLASARAVAGFFAASVELNVDLPELGQRTLDRDEITQVALMGRSRAGGLQVKFPDITVTVAPDRQSAVADLTVEANISGEHDSLVREMKFTLRKTDGRWLITRVETVHTLS